jgi:hypothetical protein
MPAFDTEKPPEIRERAEFRRGRLEPTIELRFDANPAAADLYGRWLNSGRAWEAFGEWADSQPQVQPEPSLGEALADWLHQESCDHGHERCSRYTPGSAHHDFYEMRAANLITELEPMIGIANIMPAVKVILEEMD